MAKKSSRPISDEAYIRDRVINDEASSKSGEGSVITTEDMPPPMGKGSLPTSTEVSLCINKSNIVSSVNTSSF